MPQFQVADLVASTAINCSLPVSVELVAPVLHQAHHHVGDDDGAVRQGQRVGAPARRIAHHARGSAAGRRQHARQQGLDLGDALVAQARRRSSSGALQAGQRGLAEGDVDRGGSLAAMRSAAAGSPRK